MKDVGKVRNATGATTRRWRLRRLLARNWSELITSDPGGIRFRAACRATLSASIASASLGALGAWRVIPTAAIGIGIALSIMGVIFVRAPSPRQRMLTVALMSLGAFCSATIAALLVAIPYLSEAGFLVLVFGVVALQTYGPSVVATGILSVMSAYLALFLRLAPAQAPAVLLALATAALVVILISVVLLPDQPGSVLTRLVRTVERRASLILHALADAKRADDPARLRARRSFAKLNETMLSAEEMLSVVAPATITRFRSSFMRFEIALADAAVAAAANRPLAKADAARVRLAALRLYTGRRGGVRARIRRDGAPGIETALETLRDAQAGLAAMAREAQTLKVEETAKPSVLRPVPAWAAAARATTAAFLSMVGGHLLSPDRWFWAVLTAYLLFINVRSHGETIFKGVQRIWGALAGLAVGLLVSFAFAGHILVESAGALLCLFGLAYAFPLFPALATFCITILFGLAYSMAGISVGAVLTVRFEETVIGVVSALAAGSIIFPRRTDEHIRDVGRTLLAALGEAIRASALRLEGNEAASPLGAMRQVDRAVRDLRAALKPLQAGRSLTFAPAPTELPAVISCMFWARRLASLSDLGDAATDFAAAARARQLASRIEAVTVAGPLGQEKAPVPTDNVLERPLHVPSLDAGKAAALEATLENLNAAIDLLAARLSDEGWNSLIRKRRL